MFYVTRFSALVGVSDVINSNHFVDTLVNVTLGMTSDAAINAGNHV